MLMTALLVVSVSVLANLPAMAAAAAQTAWIAWRHQPATATAAAAAEAAAAATPRRAPDDNVRARRQAASEKGKQTKEMNKSNAAFVLVAKPFIVSLFRTARDKTLGEFLDSHGAAMTEAYPALLDVRPRGGDELAALIQ